MDLIFTDDIIKNPKKLREHLNRLARQGSGLESFDNYKYQSAISDNVILNKTISVVAEEFDYYRRDDVQVNQGQNNINFNQSLPGEYKFVMCKLFFDDKDLGIADLIDKVSNLTENGFTVYSPGSGILSYMIIKRK